MERPSERTARQQPCPETERLEKAATEVDLELLALARSPRERLRAATRAQRALGKFRRHAPP